MADAGGAGAGAGGAAAADGAGADPGDLQALLQQGAADAAGLDPNLAAQLVTALKEQVAQATGKLTAELADLRASSRRDLEATERKRRKTEELAACEKRKWLTGRANDIVSYAITQQYDLGYLQEQLAAAQALLAPPPAAAAHDLGDQAPTGGRLVAVADMRQQDLAEVLRVVSESSTALEKKVAAAEADIYIFQQSEPYGGPGAAALIKHMDNLAPEHKRLDDPEFKAAMVLARQAATHASHDDGLRKALQRGGGRGGNGRGGNGRGRGRGRGGSDRGRGRGKGGGASDGSGSAST